MDIKTTGGNAFNLTTKRNVVIFLTEKIFKHILTTIRNHSNIINKIHTYFNSIIWHGYDTHTIHGLVESSPRILLSIS